MSATHCSPRGQPAILTSNVPRSARTWRILAVFAWMALITYWSSQGSLPIDSPEVANLLRNLQHRIAHLVAFGVLGLLARWAFDGYPRPWLIAVALVSAFGAADEWHQSFTPGRRAALDDWALDTASAALALYAWSRFSTSAVQLHLRRVAPVAIAAVFLLGIALAVRPSVHLPTAVSGTSLRNAAHTAVDIARSTREVARQLRSTVLG
jgi:VanZ family protein